MPAGYYLISCIALVFVATLSWLVINWRKVHKGIDASVDRVEEAREAKAAAAAKICAYRVEQLTSEGWKTFTGASEFHSACEQVARRFADSYNVLRIVTAEGEEVYRHLGTLTQAIVDRSDRTAVTAFEARRRGDQK